MKNMKNIIGLLLVIVIVSIQLLQSSQEIQSAEIAVEQVDKKMSLLDKIMQHVRLIVSSEDTSRLLQEKKELTRLMEHKDLDAAIKKAIEYDIEIIKNNLTQSELNAAYQRLLDTYKKINEQASVVDTIVQATVMVENASPEELEETIEHAKQKIEEAQQKEQGFLIRMYTKAKRLVTAPVDYVFGKETSYAKTAFYAAVGLAVLAAGKHIYETYGKREVPFSGTVTGEGIRGAVGGISIRIPSEQGLAELKKLGDMPEIQEKAILQQLNHLADERGQLNKRNEFLSQEYTKIAQQKEDVVQGKRWYFGAVENLDDQLYKIKGEYYSHKERHREIDSQQYHLEDLLKQLETIKKNPSEYGYLSQKNTTEKTNDLPGKNFEYKSKESTENISPIVEQESLVDVASLKDDIAVKLKQVAERMLESEDIFH